MTEKEINQLIELIRSGQLPALPEGKRELHYHDPALPNFYIRLLATGAASWIVQWKKLGRQKKITIGNVRVLDRSKAIEAAKKLLAKITLDMLDPHEARRERMRADKVTFATTVPLFFESKKQDGELRATTEKLLKSLLTGYYFKPLHNHPIDEITREQLQTCIAAVAAQGGKGAAKNAHTAIRLFFNWALETGKLPEGHHNPMEHVKAPAQNSRERVLTNDEIRLIWNTCEAWIDLAVSEQKLRATTGRGTRPPVNADFGRAIQLLFLTGCRAQEIGNLTRSEIDLDNAELLIPASRTKEKRELCVPLADWAVQILRSAEEDAKEQRPDDEQLFRHVMIRGRPWEALGITRQTWYRRRDKPPALANPVSRNTPGLFLAGVNSQIDRRIAKAGGIPPADWTIHDIRRTFRTHLAGLGVIDSVAEALIGHVSHRGQIVRTYNRYDYWVEKRKALAMWEASLRAIIDGTAEKFAHPRFGERSQQP